MLTPELWVAISFLIFVALIFKPTKNFIINSLDNRALKISKELEEVTALKNQALRTLLEYQKKQNDIEVDIREIIANAEQQIAYLTRNAENEITSQLNNKINKIMERIEAQESKVVNEFRFQAVDIASEVVKSVIKETMTDDFSDRLAINSLDILCKSVH